MQTESTQNKLLEKIFASNEFANSKIYQTYLKYLVESAQQGKKLKETTIAIEVFGKDAHFNSAEDTIVRSHTYTLRKKLESYYFQEGKEEKVRIQIPKGHYEIQFIPVSDRSVQAMNWFFWAKQHIVLLLCLLLTIALLILGWRFHQIEKKLNRYQTVKPSDPIWKEYLQSDLPVLLVVGDHFFFNDYSEKYSQTISIRHPKVNSMEDFQYQFPTLAFHPTPEPYFPYHSIWSLPPILSMFFSVNRTPILRKSSDINPQILNEYNIIYLGSIKTLYALKHTLLKSHFQYQILPHKIIYTPPDTNATRIYETALHSEGPTEDLVLALKLPGPVNNSIFLIASFHSLGTPEIAYYMVNPKQRMDLINRFLQKYGLIPNYFEILFRVSGIDKTAYTEEILICNEITMQKK